MSVFTRVMHRSSDLDYLTPSRYMYMYTCICMYTRMYEFNVNIYMHVHVYNWCMHVWLFSPSHFKLCTCTLFSCLYTCTCRFCVCYGSTQSTECTMQSRNSQNVQHNYIILHMHVYCRVWPRELMGPQQGERRCR